MTVLSEEQAAAVRRGVPDPGVALPRIAGPTVALWVGSVALGAGGTAAVLAGLEGALPAGWVVAGVLANATVTFTMFTVLHEAIHHAAGRLRWVNEVLGRVSMPFVAAWGTFPMVRYVHIEHHRHTNESEQADPDAWVEGGPPWQRPLRWALLDVWYFRFYLPRLGRRPRAERVGAVVNGLGVTAIVALLVATGHGPALVLAYLVPQRLGVAVLAWWFDWLPHHDLGVHARTDRFRATRVRVGMEGLMTPVMLYQNYHLVHHIHPTIPFYRYVRAWENTRADYLDRDVPIATAWGRELTPSEYRAWRGGTGDPAPSPAAGTTFHRLRVAEVRSLTADSVLVTLDVPGALHATYAHAAGQHVAVRDWLDAGDGGGRTPVRRAYSVCSAAGSGMLRIAVRRVEGGRFSRHAVRDLAVGDTLEVAPPTGCFGPDPAPGGHDGRHLVAVAAGSGITSILSVLATVLDREPASRVTLLLGNRDRASTMFAAEIAMLVARADGALRVVHRHSRATPATEGVPGGGAALDALQAETVEAGRLDVGAVLAHVPDPGRVDDWLFCGPTALTETLVDALAARGVAAGRMHREVFTAAAGDVGPVEGTVAATVSLTCGGVGTDVSCGADRTVLDAALLAGVDAPYSCAGGGCGTCAATLRHGTVHMAARHALSDAEIARGRILTCQARPTSDTVHVDYDAEGAP